MNRNRKKMNKSSVPRTLASTLALSLTVSSLLPAAALAADPAGGEANTPKEEVIYANLNADGSVDEINVVNIFDLEHDGVITDYGTYSSVRNMTSTAPVEYTDDSVHIQAESGKTYYEGRLVSDDLPWDISINYTLDGKDVSPSELAGQSGALKITISIHQNPDCDESFFKSYALQASATLDTNTCSNITADGATVANVGSDKQITFTVLPGSEDTELEISADVTDFEMAGLSINGVPLSLDMDIDTSELLDQVTELQSAIAQLDDGAGELQSGTSSAADGGSQLLSGASSLRSGAAQLQSGTGTLYVGGLALTDGSKELQNGISQYTSGVESLSSGISQYIGGTSQLAGGAAELESGMYELKTQVDKLKPLSDQIDIEELTGYLNQVQADSTKLAEFTGKLSSLLQALSDSLHSYAGSGEAVAASLESQVAEANAEIAQSEQTVSNSVSNVNEQIASVNNEIGTAANTVNSQIDAAIAAIQEQVNNGTLDQDTANGSIAALQNSKVGTTTVNSISEPDTAAASIDTPEAVSELRGLDSLVTELDNTIAKLNDLTVKLNTLSGTLGTLSDTLQTTGNPLEQLIAGVDQAYEGAAAISDGFTELKKNDAALLDGANTLCASGSTLKNGAASLTQGSTELNGGISSLYAGAGTLTSGAGTLENGVSSLNSGLNTLNTGVGTLKDGTSELRSATDGMDTKISDQIDEIMDTITGSGQELVSFVSEENTNVEAVQFVIQTEGIQKDDTSDSESNTTADTGSETEENKSFIQKFKDLF